MKGLLLASLLLALPAAVSAQVVVLDRGSEQADGGCRQGLADFEKRPTLARFRALIPCMEDPDPSVRNLAFDKLCHREVWDDPAFPAMFATLDAIAAKGERDPATFGKADTFRYWLHNSQWYYREQAKAKADQAKAADASAETAAEPRRVRLSLIFGAGIVAQTLIFVLGAGRPRLGGLAVAALFGLVGFLPGKHETNYQLHVHVAYYFVAYAFMVFIAFKDEIMARVSETNLLVNSLTLWYLCVTFLGGPGRAAVMAAAAIPTIGTLVVAFTIREWSFKTKLACYVWFLILTVANSCFQVGFGNLLFLFRRDSLPNPIDLFMTGMAFTVLAASLFYVYILIPLANKHETQAQRMERWRRDAHAMAGCFADYRLTAAQALQICALQLGFYAANHWVRFMLPGTAMNVSMVLLPLGFQSLLGRRQDAPAGAPAPVRFSEPST